MTQQVFEPGRWLVRTVAALMLRLCLARTCAPPEAKIPSHAQGAFACLELSQMVRGAG